MLSIEEKKYVAAEERKERREARAERRRLAVETGEGDPNEPDSEDEKPKVPDDLAAAFERAEQKEKDRVEALKNGEAIPEEEEKPAEDK